MKTNNNIKKEVLPHPNYELYLKQFAAIYEDKNYDSGLVGYFLKKAMNGLNCNLKKMCILLRYWKLAQVLECI